MTSSLESTYATMIARDISAMKYAALIWSGLILVTIVSFLCMAWYLPIIFFKITFVLCALVLYIMLALVIDRALRCPEHHPQEWCYYRLWVRGTTFLKKVITKIIRGLGCFQKMKEWKPCCTFCIICGKWLRK